METLRAIIRGDLPPVGNPIKLGPRQSCTLQLPGFHATWVNSGTSALALALLAAKSLRPELNRPEVIIPGYGCPDLVSACVYAGCVAKLVDIRQDGWGFDLSQLQAALSEQTLAVIGVNFLGIREDWQGINAVLAKHNTSVATIEDNAQWFPNLDDNDSFFSDFIVFSFGKGKPLSLLGGGALFSRKPLSEINSTLVPPPSKPSSLWTLKTKYFLFNQLLKPSLYWFLNHNPIFTPGQTHYKTPCQIQPLDDARFELIQTNYEVFIQTQNTLWQEYTHPVTPPYFHNSIWPADKRRIKRLLRYPLICTGRTQRDNLLRRLNNNGLGATAMYQNALADISCPAAFVDASLPQQNARNLAECLITLPCHIGVSHIHSTHINRCLIETKNID